MRAMRRRRVSVVGSGFSVAARGVGADLPDLGLAAGASRGMPGLKTPIRGVDCGAAGFGAVRSGRGVAAGFCASHGRQYKAARAGVDKGLRFPRGFRVGAGDPGAGLRGDKGAPVA